MFAEQKKIHCHCKFFISVTCSGSPHLAVAARAHSRLKTRGIFAGITYVAVMAKPQAGQSGRGKWCVYGAVGGREGRGICVGEARHSAALVWGGAARVSEDGPMLQ